MCLRTSPEYSEYEVFFVPGFVGEKKNIQKNKKIVYQKRNKIKRTKKQKSSILGVWRKSANILKKYIYDIC